MVSLDLDGTLVHPAAVTVIGRALGMAAVFDSAHERWRRGEVSDRASFEEELGLLTGQEVAAIQAALAGAREAWSPGVAEAVAAWRAAGCRVIVCTDVPRVFAEVALEFGVQDLVCMDVEVVAGRMTGGYDDAAFDKAANLQRWLEANGFQADEVVHVGNGSNDIPVFGIVRAGVAVHAHSDAVREAATLDLGEPASFTDVVAPVLALLDLESGV